MWPSTTVTHLYNASLCGRVSNSNRITIKTRLHLRFSRDFPAIELRFGCHFAASILLKLWKVVTLCRSLKSEELVLKRTCVEETLVLRPLTYEYLPLIGDPFLLFPFVTFFAVPVFTVSPAMFLFSTKRRDVRLFWGLHQGSVWNTIQVKISAKSQLNSSKFETLAISRRFNLQIAVKSPVVLT